MRTTKLICNLIFSAPNNCIGRNPVVLLFVVVSLVLSGCAAGKAVSNPDKAIDDGKRNTVLLSYDIRLQSNDRYPGVTGTQLALRCSSGNKKDRYSACLYLNIPFKAQSKVGEYLYNSFERNGVQLFQIKYGQYTLARANYSVLTGKRRKRVCLPYRKKIKHHYDFYHRCHDEFTDINADFLADFPVSTSFSVDSGDACYLGHLTLHLRGSSLLKYEFDPALSPDIIARLPIDLQAVARARITRNCVTPDHPS